MCGICGFVSLRGGEGEVGEILAAMTDAIAHRGPDGEGLYRDLFSSGGGAALGHRRLAIIDLVTGDQPLFNESRRLAIVFNGEIYNFAALREELAAKGHVFATSGDTETIIHLYEEMGPRCVTRLRGMFALAIWDAAKRELFLARDPFGKKPLYYTAIPGGGIAFGSEPKALFAHPDVHPRLDPTAVAHYLTLQHVPSRPRALPASAPCRPATPCSGERAKAGPNAISSSTTCPNSRGARTSSPPNCARA